MISCSWSQEELDTFISYVFKTLETLCDRDAVLNADRMEPLGVTGTRASMEPIEGGKRLETYWRLKNHDWWLYPCVASMVEFLVRLDTDNFYALVEQVDHPVIHLRAARCVVDRDATADHCTPLQWLTKKPTEPLVALAIVHTLDNINSLDSDLRHRTDIDRVEDNAGPVASILLNNMIKELGKVEPTNCAEWIVELLNHSTTALNRSAQDEKPDRVEQLDTLCSQQLERLTQSSWSDNLMDVFRSSLSPAPPFTPRIPAAASANCFQHTRIGASAFR